MLLDRGIFLQVCLLLSTRCYCQDYETYDSEDAPEESGPVDYSKYYAVDTSAPLVSAQGNPSQIGFTSPIEYAGFFDPSIDFGATIKQEVAHPKNPFAAQTKSLGFVANQGQFPDFASSPHFPIDYFEEAQKTQRQENQEDDGFLPSGPTYISHNLPINLEADYSSGVEKVQPKPKKNKNKKVHHYDVEKEAAAEYEYQPSSPSGKYADYSTGKSGSTVSQNPSGYYEKPSQAPTPTPYQKYSFQPVAEEGAQSKYLTDLISTVAPFNPAYTKVASTAAPVFETQSSENIPSHLKEKNCRRVRKHIPAEDEHGREKREAMNCFVCEDPDSSSKYTQCSYAVDPEPKNDYSGVSERYSTPPKDPSGFRYKRYSGDDNIDPYEYIRSRSQKEYEKEYEEYKVPEFYTADDGLDKSFSEIQSEAVSKNPANCHKEESNGMTCTICKDPESGGNYEQCSYTSEPKEKKYAYVTEKKYDSDEPEHGSETKPAVQTTEIESSIKSIPDNKNNQPVNEPSSSNNQKKVVKLDEPTLPSIDISKYEKLEDFSDDSKEFKSASTNDDAQYKQFENFKPAELYKSNYQGHEKFKLSDKYNPESTEDPNKEPFKPEEGYKGAQSAPKKLINDDPYDIPKHFAESTIKEQKALRKIEPSYYGSAESAESEDADSSSGLDKDIDEYHFKLFPEFSHQESQQAEIVTKPSADTTRKDVEEVLAEFTKKDRSACKKAQKNGMTCYLCVDDKGIQHEECMYVSESKPQASHVAYHEVKQLKAPEAKEQTSAATENNAATTSAPVVLEAAASEEHASRIRYNPKKNSKKVKKVREQERAATRHIPEKDETFEDEPKKETPAEFVVGAEEGAFSAETKPVYSKALGVKLPRYMIEKSEFEKEFDEFAGNH